MLELTVAVVALRMDRRVQRQAATAERHRGAQQMQRLARLEIAPVDHDQRLDDTVEQHPRQGTVDRAAVALHVVVAQRTIGSLDAMA